MSIPSRITFSHLVNVIKSSGTNNIVPLGRWSLRSVKHTGLISDYSNEDHCGTCGDYINEKKNMKLAKQESDKIYDIEYQYMVSNNPN